MPQFETGSKKLSISSIVAPQQTKVTTADDINALLGTVAKTSEEYVKVVDNEVMTDKSRRYNEARANYQRGLESANGDPFATNEVWGKFKAETQSLIDEGGFINQESQNKLQGTIINEISQRELYHNNVQRQYMKSRFKDSLTEQLVMDDSDMTTSYTKAQEIAKLYNITDMNEVAETMVDVLKNNAKMRLSTAGDNLSKEMIDEYDNKLTSLAKLDKKLEGKAYYADALVTINTFRNQYNATGKELIKQKIATEQYIGNPKALQADLDKYDFSATTKEALTLSNQANTKAFYEKQYSETVQAILMNPEPSAKDRATANRLMKQLGKSQEYIDSFNARLDHKEDTKKDALANKLFEASYNAASINISSGGSYDPKAIDNLLLSAKKAVVAEDGSVVPVSKEAQELVATNKILFAFKANDKAFISTTTDTLPKFTHSAVKAYAENEIMKVYNSNDPNKIARIATINQNYGTSNVLQDNYTRALQDPAQFDKAYSEIKELRAALPNTYKEIVGDKTAGVFELANTIKTLDGEKTINSRIMKEAEQKYGESIYLDDRQRRKVSDAIVSEGIVSGKLLNEDITGAMKIGKSFDEALKFGLEQQKRRVVGVTDLSGLKVDLRSEEKDLIKAGESYVTAPAGEVLRGIKYDENSRTIKILYKNGGSYDTGMSYDEYKEWIRDKQPKGEQVD